MKTSGPDHPKTRRFMRLFGCGKAQAIGHLELLFHFAYEFASQGDIGRWSDAEIADACDVHPDDATRFVRALRDARWLDLDSRCRYVIHDWEDHAYETVKKRIRRQGLEFIKPDMVEGRDMSGQSPDMSSAPPDTAGHRPDMSRLPSRTEPSLAEPNPTEPNRAQPTRALQQGTLVVSSNGTADADTLFDDYFWPEYPRREGKKAARRAWRTLRPTPRLLKLILTALAWQRRLPQWREGKIPHPATYLNGERWKDEPPDQAPIDERTARTLAGLEEFVRRRMA